MQKDDVIYKQAAIDTIMGQPPEPHYPSWYAAQIENLPSAQPERKKGTWIAVDYFADGKQAYREWECSACGCVVEDEKPTWNFCPMCGADMRGEQK